VKTSYRSRITFTGSEEVINRLKGEVDKLLLVAEDAVNDGLLVLYDGAKDDCPVNTDPSDTATIRLKDSIYIEPAKKHKRSIVGRVRVGKKTAMHVEFGTSKMSPRPFLRQQIFFNRAKIRKMTRDKIKSAMGL
jgi:HK97 gp10 family phage protein